MNGELKNYLTNVPHVEKDAYNELSQIIDEKLKTRMITSLERDRLFYELGVIKETGAAGIFLFALNALKGFSDGEHCFLSKENNCFINYFLRLTSVNPVKYGLPFELFFNAERNYCTKFCFYVKRGTRERLLNNISDNYKVTQFINGNDNGCRYFIDIADKAKIKYKKDDSGRMSYTEVTAEIPAEELAMHGLFEFDVSEYESNEIVAKDFSTGEIYDETIRTVAYKPAIISMKPFEKIDDIKEILSSTGGKLIYQEQVVAVLNRVCGFDVVTADCARKAICTKKQNFNDKVAEILHNKYGKDGDEFFKYLLGYGLYTVSEGYVIASMKNNIKWEKR